MSDATCKTCPFYQPVDGDRGYCHHAATLATPEDIRPRPDWWCSEHPLRQRDRLAAMAMQGLATRDRLEMAVPSPWLIAERAYEIADAMIDAIRAKGETP